MKDICALVLLCSPLLIYAQTITLNYEQTNAYPWYVNDGRGVDLILLKMVDDALPEVTFKYKKTPWKRCLYNIQWNVSEGCFSGSFKEKRKVFGLYPGGDIPDEDKRIHATSYSLYTLKGSNIDVTGKLNISGVNGSIAAQTGYSIVDDLTSLGYDVDAGSSSTERNFKKLLKGRAVAVAALTLNGNNILAQNSSYSDKIQVIETPLVLKSYYVLLSKYFVKNNRDLAEKIWNKIAEIRESEPFKAAAHEFLLEKR